MRVLRSSDASLGRQPGELGRLKILSGPDQGKCFVLLRAPVLVGRGETCDVVLSDLKASRSHLKLDYAPNQGWKFEDLGSQNGTDYNGKRTASSSIKSLDAFQIGETWMEFMGTDLHPQVLQAPGRPVAQVMQAQAAQKAQSQRLQSLFEIGGLMKLLKKSGQNLSGPAASSADTRKKIIYAIMGIGMAAVLFYDDTPAPTKKSSKPKAAIEAERNLASLLPTDADPAVAKTAETFFRSGFREYREANYLRAKVQFETVLQMDPSHELAKLYLRNADKEIEDEVTRTLNNAKKARDVGKYQEAKGHLEAVLRLLARTPDNPHYSEAKTSLEELRKKEAVGS